MSAKRKTHAQFLSEANAAHNNKFQYPEQYKGSRGLMTITCPVHGDFTQRAYSHLAGNGCHQCDVIDRAERYKITHEEFVKRGQEKHGNKYSYPDQYTHSQSFLTIVCPEHGSFKQLANSHMLGHGCQKCAQYEHQGCYSENYFINAPHEKDHPGIFYVLRGYDFNSTFIKIGITKRIYNRRHNLKHEGVDNDVIHVYNMPLYDAWTNEQRLLKELSHQRYEPEKFFGGRTECLWDRQSVLEHIEEALERK